MYDFSKLKLNPDAIYSILEVKGNILRTKEDVQFIFPKRFDSREFNTYEDAIRIMGIFAIVDTKGNYAVHNIPNRLVVSPNVTDSTIINNEDYVVMTFYKDNIISNDTTMVKDTSYLNSLYNEFIVLGKVPAFFSYTDLLKTFKRTLHFNGSPVGKYNAPLQLLTSLIAKDIKDKNKPFRYSNDNLGLPGSIYWIGLSNVHYAITSTLSKLGGGYASQAVFSAVGNEQEMSELEDLLLT